MAKYKPIKIEKADKKLFREFRQTKFTLLGQNPVHDILMGYVNQVLKYRSKGLYLYGDDEIKAPDQKGLDELQEKLTELVACKILTETEKIKTQKYVEHAKDVAEKLNKYVVVKEKPAYMLAMKNYAFMRETLKDTPYFHDAYIISCEQKGKDIFVKFALYGYDKLFIENNRIFKLQPKARYKRKGKQTQIAITIKFANAKIIGGLINEDWANRGSEYFLMDLEFEKTENGKYKFLLGSFAEYTLTLECDNIEFVENTSPFDSTYLVPNIQRNATHYYEFQKGKTNDAFWLDTSICINECDDDDGSVMEIISLFIKNYCQFSSTYLNELDAKDFVKQLKRFGELLGQKKSILESLEIMSVYEPAKAKSVAELSKEYDILEERVSRFQERIQQIDLKKLERTAKVLANWIDETIKTHGAITIKGV